ncbi:RING finger protein 17-like, partial [Saccoglossus kowalevskii]|uniref:Tudor domain-containing protein 1-like n=1 Tax=Saccoglossus kowalevskii TaxID=10224 RepID=A0ABM0MYZ8_SACKO
ICIQRVGPQGDGDSLANGAVEGLEELEKISAEMNKRADEFERIENPIPGMACCGQYAYDDEWYRAEVLKVKSVSPLTVEVIYVDYGTTETIPVDRLRELPEEFKILPIQGVRCDLVGLKPPRKIPDDVTLVTGSDWPEGSMLALTKLVVDQRLTACIIKDISKPVKILLFNGIPSDKHCSIIFQTLIEQGLAEMDGDVIDKFTKDFCHLGLKTILSEKTLQMATNEA